MSDAEAITYFRSQLASPLQQTAYDLLMQHRLAPDRAALFVAWPARFDRSLPYEPFKAVMERYGGDLLDQLNQQYRHRSATA